MLAKFLSTTDFAGQFDLVYVPMDKTSGNNLGYSFINFVEASSCERFLKAMNGTKASKCFPGSRSGKVMQCSYAKVQGAEPYCTGLANAASKLCAMGDELGALETLTPVPITKEPSAKQPAQFQGLRSEAPEFVPGKINADALMETFSAYVQAKSHHQEAFARARAYSSKLFVPGQSAIYVAPKADKENVPAETK
jgi:RNA recognition motif-containing protein